MFLPNQQNMKKLLLGSVSLLIFAIAIAVVEISCQKSIAQITTTLPSGHTILYHTIQYDSVVYQIGPDTPADSTTNTANHHNKTELYEKHTYFISNIDGGNEKQIPVAIPVGLYSGDYAKLTDNGTTFIFSLYEISAPPTQNSISLKTFYIYSCNIDGSNLKKIKDGDVLDDVH